MAERVVELRGSKACQDCRVTDLIVHIVAPVDRDAGLLASTMNREGVETCILQPQSLQELLPDQRDSIGTLLVAEEGLTPESIRHLAMLLDRQPAWSDLPILVLISGGLETEESRRRDRERLPLGNLMLLERPLRAGSLLSSVKTALRARERQYQVRDTIRARDKAMSALRESEERNRLILQSTRDCIKLLDLEGNLLSMNAEGQARLGIDDFSQVCNKPWFAFWNGEDKTKAQTALACARNGGEGRFEAAFLTPRGEATWWDVSVTPVVNEQRQMTHLLVVSREITDRKQTEKALIQSEKLAAVGRLAASISHEINNPLEAVTNLLYLATSDSGVPDSARSYLTQAEDELRRVSLIVGQTLRFHRQASLPRFTAAEALIDSVVSLYRARIRNARVRVDAKRVKPGSVVCYEGDIRQVLNNLVGNAIDAMRSGGVLSIRARPATNWHTGQTGMAITIADSGTGMTDQVRRRIFEPFFTTKGTNGTGLGLWISNGIVKRHHGRLAVRSRTQPAENTGTVFRLFLPRNVGIELVGSTPAPVASIMAQSA